MKLLFDQMLGNLARWCRILGIDSGFFTGESDSQLIGLAKKQDRIVITRDSELAKRCGRSGPGGGIDGPEARIGCVLVKDGTLEEQIAQILKETGAAVTFPEKTRCASCNGELVLVPKAGVEGEVEKTTFAHHERFWRCSGCKKLFWEGGHWKNITRIYGKAKSLMDAYPPL
ncbi:MAG: Mut7-C RNAse domain-containing protein [Candidatus Micrarchaeota archaeon]